MKNYKTTLFKSFRASALKMPYWLEEAAKNGFQGVEITGARDLPDAQAIEFRHRAESLGLRIHSSSFGWVNLNDPDQTATDLAKIKKGLRTAQLCGADAILLVPGKIEPVGVLPACDFQMEFDPQTCLISRVAKGDNAPYQEYIRQQNQATELCFRALEQIIPIAAYEGITIGIENVWSNLWVTPELMSAFVRHFDSTWIKIYFDLGNHLKYAPTERWLHTLGSDLIAKLHIKDFTINRDLPDGGKFVPIGKGDINWLSVRDTLEEIGYSGWVSLEDVPNFYSLKEHSEILDRVFTGKSPVTNR